MKNILIIQPIDKSGIEILENHPDYNFEIIDGTNLEEIKKKDYWMWRYINKNCQITCRSN